MSHARDFGLESQDEETARQLVDDYRQASLSNPDRALCDYAVKLTLAPDKVDAQDIAKLSENGFSQEQITVAVQVVGYFNYINRVAEGLGVDPEPWMTPPREQWLREKARDYSV